MMIVQICVGSSCHLKGSADIVALLQKAVEILPGDTPEMLQKRVMEEAEWKLLPAALAMVCNEEIEL